VRTKDIKTSIKPETKNNRQDIFPKINFNMIASGDIFVFRREYLLEKLKIKKLNHIRSKTKVDDYHSWPVKKNV